MFQSPEGDSLRLQCGAVTFGVSRDGFQSPEGDSLRLQYDHAAALRSYDWGFSPPKGTA